MKYRDSIRKYWLIIFIVSLLYFLYAFFVLSPHSYKHFSLIDDGQSIQNSYLFDECFNSGECAPLKEVLIEKQFGRFRPGYWGIQHILYKVLGINPILHHQFRVYFVGYLLLLLLMASAIQARGGPLSVILSAGIFVSSFSFSENIIRLGPQEPYQLLFIGFFSLIYLSRSSAKWTRVHPLVFTSLLAFILLAAITVKEPSFIIVFAPLFISFLYSKKESDKKLSMRLTIFAVLIVVVGRLLARPQNGALAYVENFNLNFRRIIENSFSYLSVLFNSTSPFVKITIVSIPLFALIKKLGRKVLTEQLIYWVIISILSFGILLPWKFVLDRYMLITLFSVSVVIGVLLSRLIEFLVGRADLIIQRKIHKIILNMFIFIALSNLFFHGYPINLAKSLNYRNWYKEFLLFEYEQVSAMAKLEKDSVYLNATDSIDNWEVLFEIPIHLKYIHREDIKTHRLEGDLPEGANIFTRSPFGLVLEISDLENLNYELVSNKSYDIKQIDPIKFKDEFVLRPIQTIAFPPYKDETLSYYWEVRIVR